MKPAIEKLTELLKEAQEAVKSLDRYIDTLEGKVKKLESETTSEKSPETLKVEKKVRNYMKCPKKGDLDLKEAPIKTLPDNLHVGGSLDLMESSIEEIPEGLTVYKNLYLEYTPLSEHLTAGVIRQMIEDKGGKIFGNIHVEKTKTRWAQRRLK